jgi:hypothetical protein
VAGETRDSAGSIAEGGAVAELLTALCDITGMGFAVVAEVSADSWTARAVLDRLNLGIVNGSRLDISTTLCREVRRTRRAIVIDHAAVDARYAEHPTPKLYGFQSYISVPIFLANKEYFGNLCALHTRPGGVSDPRIQLMFHCYARLIAEHIDARATRGKKRLDPLNQYIVGNLRSLFAAMLTHPTPACGDHVGGAGERDPALRQLAARVATQGHRLSSLVNDVLAYARGRLNGGMPGYIWKVDDLNARLKAVVADTLAANPNRVIITNIAFDEPVDCDPALIQALATNLLNNALAHGAPSGPVSFIASTHDNDLEIAVWHEGNVNTSASMRTLFAPPALLGGTDGAAARQELHRCAKIVRAHLGTIGVTSSPTEGTQFVAKIPLVRSLRLH